MIQRILARMGWLVVIAFLALVGRFLFGLDFWTAVAFGTIGWIGNALLIEWEDNRPGGWGNP